MHGAFFFIIIILYRRSLREARDVEHYTLHKLIVYKRNCRIRVRTVIVVCE